MSEFLPDWVSPPGDTLSDIAEERRISRADLASLLGLDLLDLRGLLGGSLPVTPDLAARLSILGATPAFWLRREAQFREDLARVSSDVYKKALRPPMKTPQPFRPCISKPLTLFVGAPMRRRSRLVSLESAVPDKSMVALVDLEVRVCVWEELGGSGINMEPLAAFLEEDLPTDWLEKPPMVLLLWGPVFLALREGLTVSLEAEQALLIVEQPEAGLDVSLWGKLAELLLAVAARGKLWVAIDCPELLLNEILLHLSRGVFGDIVQIVDCSQPESETQQLGST